MGKRTKTKRTKIGYEEAIGLLPAAQKAVDEASLRYSDAYDDAMAALTAANATVAEQAKTLADLRERRDELQAIVTRGESAAPSIVSEMVENPLLTSGLLEEGQQVARFIRADKNMTVLIGGFARVTGRTEEQTLAAAKFRMLHERAQLGGAKAVDYGAVRVDTSGPTEEAVAEIGAHARQQYADAVQAIGLLNSSVVERVVIHDMSLRELAMAMELGDSGGARRAARHKLFEAVNTLVEHFGLRAGAGARHRLRGWNDGAKAA